MGREAKLHRIYARDGWRLALWRHQGEGPVVFCCHGLGANRYDFDCPRRSFAAWLAKQGCDVWIVELRGAGKSAKPGLLGRWDWLFEDYIEHDVPAAVEAVQEMTGAEGLHWIGHSLGGVIGYAYLPKAPAGLFRSCITVGSPMPWGVKLPFPEGSLEKYIPLLGRLPYIPYGDIISFFGRFFMHPRLVAAFDGQLISVANTDPEDLRFLAINALERLSTPLIVQSHDWFRSRRFVARDGYDYEAAMADFDLPTLLLAGAADGLTPAEGCREVLEKIASPKKKLMIFGRDAGCQEDYGHADLILGRRAEEEVYRHVIDWIREHD